MEMKYSPFTLTDLPDEMVMKILKNLNEVDVLYSLYGVNERLTQLVRDPIFVKRLSFVKQIDKDLHHHITSNEMLHRLCSEVLLSIADQIHRFDLESSSIKEIFSAADYPNLADLALYNMSKESARLLFTDERLSSGLFQKRIRTLLLTIDDHDLDDGQSSDEMYSSMIYICENLFTVFDKLVSLTFDPSSEMYSIPLSFEDGPLHSFCSSTLLKLKIRVEYFEDCLYLFDGRFSQLHTVDLKIAFIHDSKSILNKGHLSKMKCFSICCEKKTHVFERTILLLLSRMSNLEELHLRLRVHLSYGLIDEMYMKTILLPRLPRLCGLSVFIQSSLFLSLMPSNFSIPENVKKNSDSFSNNLLISYGEYFPEANQVLYHLCSLPCLTTYFYDISNRFRGGRFDHVRRVTLYDEKPFEHEFFLRIEKCFPLLEHLFVFNFKAQERQQSQQLTNGNPNISPILYKHLTFLDLVGVHDHYIEQFLLDQKCHYAQELTLYINCQSLERVIDHLSRDQIRINSDKVTRLCFRSTNTYSHRFEEYFPRAKIHQERF